MRSNTSSRKNSNKNDKRDRKQTAPVRATVDADASFQAHLEKLHRLLRSQHPVEHAIAAAVSRPELAAAPVSASPVTKTTAIEPAVQGVSMMEVLDAFRAMSMDDKSLDSANHFTVSPLGTVVDVLNISPGVSGSERTGDYIRLRRFVLNYEIRYNLAAGSPCGVLVVVGKNHDAVPGASNVFSMSASTTEANSLSLLPSSSEFDVRWIKFNHHNSTSSYSNVKGEIIINPKWLAQFKAGSASCIDGDLFFAVISDNAPGTYPQFWYNFRVEYTDADA